MNIYGVIVDGISESAMTLFQLCIYTVFANQAIQAAGYFIFAIDPKRKGILHCMAPIARVSMHIIDHRSLSNDATVQFRIFGPPSFLGPVGNPTDNISNCVYHEHSAARNSSIFWTGVKEPILNFFAHLRLWSLYRVQLFSSWQFGARIPIARNGPSARDRRSKVRLPAWTKLVELWFWSQIDNVTPRNEFAISRVNSENISISEMNPTK